MEKGASNELVGLGSFINVRRLRVIINILTLTLYAAVVFPC